MGVRTVEELMEYYESYLGLLDEPDEFGTEIPLVLIARDDLEDRWSALSAEQRRHVQRLDDTLVEKHELVASILPSRLSTDRRRWWWFLHEGPQVRGKTQAA